MQDPGRLAYQTAQSLFASWVVLLSCWPVFGKARWSLRILAPLTGMAVIFILVLVNFRGHHHGIWQLVIGALVVLAASSVLPAVFSNLRDWYNWQFMAKYQAFIVLFTLGTALVFRSHGWRLRRASTD